MKKLLFSAIITCFVFAANAQTKAIQTVKISTPTVQCDMCKKRIEDVLKRYDGVMTVNVNYKKKETTVKFITDRTNVEIIKAGIANAGYDANEIAANPEVYKTLPKCCKKPDEPKKD
jgi:copper chaperone CopZ